MNPKLIYSLLAICITIIVILVLVFETRGKKPMDCGRSSEKMGEEEGGQDAGSQIFQDLTPREIMQVKTYLQFNLGVLLIETLLARPSDNCIYSITLQLPPKAEVLQFLDHQGTKPVREALAVVHFGNQPHPNVTEFVVGPLPKPKYHKDITLQKYGRMLPYSQRFPLTSDVIVLYKALLLKEYPKAPNFMRKVLDYPGKLFMFSFAFPPGLKSGDRAVWLNHLQLVSGSHLHPTGFEIQMNFSSLDRSQWTVSKAFYNGQYFEGMKDIEKQFNMGNVKINKIKQAPLNGGYSSLKKRVPPKAPGPLHYEPRGPRYRIQNNHVTFMGWSLAFGIDINRGPRLFDVRFRGERIIYELSLQDASVLYGSNSPTMMSARSMDMSFGFGSRMYTLTQGVDCPYLATYLDVYTFLDTSFPTRRKKAICIFEQNAELPLRRHYESIQSPFYGGLEDSSLVIRFISVLSNYNYIWNFAFHQNGAVGVHVLASGYIQTSFYFGDATDFGNRVQEWVLGTIHTHNIQFKVDMDIHGVKNTLVGNDMAFETMQAPWSPEHKIHRMKMVRKVLDTENKAAFRLRDNMPRYIYFAANNSDNKWGHEKGYRIQIVSFAGDHLSESDPLEPGFSWGRYKLAVTKRKEKEPCSNSVYSQIDPWDPPVAFADFINNETIVNEDLVAWINTGFLHIPHAEDIPNTVTVGNLVGFFLRPYNYFDDDPSMYSPDSIFFTSLQNPASCEVNQLACLPKVATCLPHFPPFSYEGFQNMTTF
ncbi:membrane primary amine oxidase-like [Python bivittatus]|uniref:Amine oxidase n=1 Tax=Python bivittatus TaxID=176946 RepID=A0A9F2RCQ2_PYTBI|nr:membrane primary amine oxidase-like [Python bivittatus]